MPRARLVHCADVHLDPAVADRHDGRRRRVAEAVRESFDALVELCLAEGAQGLLIAGDLADGRRLSPATASFLAARLERLAAGGVTTCLVAGNHDPGPALRAALPAGACELFDAPEARSVTLRDGQGRPVVHVVGCGHEQEHVTDDLAARVSTAAAALPEDGLPRVGLVHTQVVDARGSARHAPYAPTARATLAEAPVDYWALGHVHRRQTVLEQPLTCYPGNLQGRHRHESGPKGALVLDLGDGPPRVRFEPLSVLRFETVGLDDLADVRHPHDLLPRLRDGLPRDAGELSVHAVLSGPCPLAAELHEREARDDLAEQLADELGLFALRLDARDLHAPLDLAAQREGRHVLAHVLAVLDELRADPARLAEGLDGELAAPGEGEDATRRAAELLAGLEHEAARLLLDGPRP